MIDPADFLANCQIFKVFRGGVPGPLVYKGLWNATTNTPTLASSVGTQGDVYRVSVAGSTNLNGITDWQVGDLAIFLDGVWTKEDNTFDMFVTGPASSTDNAIARFDGTTGKLVQNSGVILSDANELSGLAALQSTSITVSNLVNTGGDTFLQKDFSVSLPGPTYTMSTANGHSQAFTITGNVNITMPPLPAANTEKEILMEIIMNGTGGYTVEFTGATYDAGIPPTIKTDPNAVTHLGLKGTSRAWTMFASYQPA